MLLGGYEAFDISVAPEYKKQMAELVQVSAKLSLWLVTEGIGPDRFFVVIEKSDEGNGFEFGFRIDYRYEEEFVEAGREFWELASMLLPLKERMRNYISAPDFDPMKTVSTGPKDFLLMIQPDLTSSRYEFPPQEFWDKRTKEWLTRSNEPLTLGNSRGAKHLMLVASDGVLLDS